MKWINRCPPYDTQNFNGNDALDCVAESLCHIFFMITGIRVSPRALAVMAHLEIPANRDVDYVLAVANSMGLVLWDYCPTPESFTFQSYYTPLTPLESITFPVTFKLMAPDINISPLWTELAWGLQLAIPTRHMVAQVTGLKPGDFVHTLGDAHLYSNHLEQTNLQLSREPRNLPIMNINPEINDIFAFKFEDFKLSDYDPHPHIKAKVAI